MTLLDYQAQLRDIVIGPGTDYDWGEGGPEGFFDLPALRSSNVLRPQDHGVFSGGPDFFDQKPVTLAINILGDSVGDVLNRRDALAAAFAPDPDGAPEPFIICVAGRTVRVIGKPNRFAAPSAFVPQSTMQALGEFVITDPRIYDDDEQTGSTGFASTSGGLGFPFGFPFGFGTVVSGSITVLNAGNFPTRPSARLTAGVGGLTGPRITLLETGELLALDGLVLAQGEYVDIDWDKRTVLLGGTASRSGTLTRPLSTWFELPAGTSTVQLSGTGTGTLALFWRSASV